MYKVIMVSPGGVKRDFHGGFETEKIANGFASIHEWEYTDENGFVWNLEVVEDIEPVIPEFVMPNKQWARTYLELQQASDESALQYLSDIMENTFSREERNKYFALRHLVDSLLELNLVVIEMETGAIEYISEIDGCYRHLSGVLYMLCETCLNE